MSEKYNYPEDYLDAILAQKEEYIEKEMIFMRALITKAMVCEDMTPGEDGNLKEYLDIAFDLLRKIHTIVRNPFVGAFDKITELDRIMKIGPCGLWWTKMENYNEKNNFDY